MTTEVVASTLQNRLGPRAYERRLRLEQLPEPSRARRYWGLLRAQRIGEQEKIIETAFRCIGLYSRGRRNAADLQLLTERWQVPGLQQPLRILHLADLHFTPGDDLVERIADRVAGLEYDLTLVAGDYRFPLRGDITPAVEGMTALRQVLPGPVWSVLGNHDSMDMVAPMEAAGMPFLLNESVRVREDVQLIGIDDPTKFRSDDLPHAMREVPSDDACRILLAHTCETWPEAEAAGIHFHLSGHTHGGQICLPGGQAILHNLKVPRHMNQGRWAKGDLQGYVSRGTGSCGVLLRFNCLPEATLHCLEPQTI